LRKSPTITRVARAVSVLALLLVPALAAAQIPDGSYTADSYLDPLAFTRVDAQASDQPLTIQHEATGETRLINGRQLLLGSQEIYLPSAAVATILKAGRYWQGSQRRLELKVGARSFTVIGGNRLVRVDEGEILLPVPVLDYEGDLWLPMVFFEQVVGPQMRERMAWDRESFRLSIGSAEYNVTRLRVEVLGRSTAVHIQCTEALGFRADSPSAGVIDLKIYNGTINASAVGQSGRRGLVHSARGRQRRDFAVISLRVDDLVGRYRTYTADDGKEIVLVLEEEQVSALPDPVPRGHARVNIDQGPLNVTHDIQVRTVVIDAGHGGHDVGAVGRRGILEKNVNLGVARELRRYLERESELQVVLTRDDDSHLELTDRAEIANGAKGDLFISLHCNSWFNDGARGLETYFLSPADSDWAKSVEAAENQGTATAGPEADDVEFIVWELVQNRFISSSSQLAEVVQTEVLEDLDLQDRGVRQAGFRVLVGAYMPAVLIELGFLSHAEEERQLGDRTYQRRLARAIGDAVLEYQAQVNIPEPVVETDFDGAEDGGREE
jgi:N-acetylmuramoyl-L-alanine amidase